MITISYQSTGNIKYKKKVTIIKEIPQQIGFQVNEIWFITPTVKNILANTSTIEIHRLTSRTPTKIRHKLNTNTWLVKRLSIRYKQNSHQNYANDVNNRIRINISLCICEYFKLNCIDSFNSQLSRHISSM